MGMNPFTFHSNIYLEEINGELVGTCPFCKHEPKNFYANPETNLWECKSKNTCGKKGNLYTFIQMFHEEVCIPDQLKLSMLSMERGIHIEYFTLNNIRWNPLQECYAIPSTNSNGAINNLYKVVLVEGKRRIFSTPDLPQALFNWPAEIKQNVWLVEGHFDKLAAQQITAGRDITVIAFPGNAFPQTWCNVIAGKDVVIFVDHDDAGKEHLERICKRISHATQKPKSIRTIKYPDTAKKGYDINDVLIDNPTKETCEQFIINHITHVTTTSSPESNVQVLECKSLLELDNLCKKCYHWTEDMGLLLLLQCTSIYSLKFEGEQLWIRGFGPPGSAKTTVARLLDQSSQVVIETSITGIFSGFERDDKPGEDCSLIPLIMGKALIITDADTLVNEPNSRQIMSQFRTVYDKDISVRYRTGLHLDYKDVRTVFHLLGTHELRHLDDTALGERFVDFELEVSDNDRYLIQLAVTKRQQLAARSGINPELIPKMAAKSLIDDHLMNDDYLCEIKDDVMLDMIQAANIITYMRASVKRDRNGIVKGTPIVEVPSRITGQLTKMLMCAPIVMQDQTMNDLTMKLMYRVSLDIMNRRNKRLILSRILCNSNSPLSLGDLMAATSYSKEICSTVLADMHELNMLDIALVTDGVASLRKATLKSNLKTQLQLVLSNTSLRA